MGLSVTLATRAQRVDPGSSVTFELTVGNDGTEPERVRLQVGGPGRPFSFCVPDALTLAPGQSEVARVGFRVPRTSLPAAGPLPFTVTATGGSAGSPTTVDGMVEVLPFSVLSVTLDPPEATTRGASSHRVNIANRGNGPCRVNLSARHDDSLAVSIEPPSADVAPDTGASATVAVAPRQKRFTGDDRELPFTVVVTPEGGAPLEVAGRVIQQAKVATGKLVTSAVVAGVLLTALIVGAVAMTGGSSGSNRRDGEPTAAGPSACPAEGHRDPRGVSGLRPDDIPLLPNTYSFYRIKADGCSPLRFNPCEPIHYVQNAELAPPTGAADVREAFRRLGQATGITFVDDGLTDETGRRSAYVPDRYPGRWAPILVVWSHFGDQGPDPTVQAVGRGIGINPQGSDVLVSGMLSLNVDAVTDREARTPLEGGFGPPVGSGTGAIGPKAVTWGRVILHELAHVVGLGHTKDKGSIMYPETADQTARPSEYKEPDLEGLRYLGREAGCLPTPPVPSS